MFRFAFPHAFVLLALLPVIMVYRRRRRTRPVMRFSDTSLVKGLGNSMTVKFARLLPAFKYLAFILMVFALARPQWGTRQITVLTEGINIILAVDVSGSMKALDFKRDGKIVDRLEAVKGVVRDFIAERKGDRIGMVVFGTYAFTQLPLTRDYNTISYVLDHLKIGAAGGNTAIGDAIGISLKRLEDIESKSNIIILLTDGQSNTGELTPLAAADIAAEQHVKIYTIGVGTRGKAPFLIDDPFFGKRYVYQKVDIDEETLTQIARKTGGHYFRAENTQALARIYQTIDGLEKNRVKTRVYAHYREMYADFLWPALGLLMMMTLLQYTRFLRIP